MPEIPAIDGRTQRSPDEQPVYTHSSLSAGVGVQGEEMVVVIHLLMGPHKDEVRITAANARIIAQHLLDSADKVDGLKPIDGYPHHSEDL